MRCRDIQCVLHGAFFLLLTGEGDFASWFAGGGEGRALGIL